MRKVLAFLAVLGLALPSFGEIRYVAVSATSTSQSIGINAKYLTLVNDGSNEVYIRVFKRLDTVAAATTAYAEVKSGESLSFTDVKAISIICDTAETATVRLFIDP